MLDKSRSEPLESRRHKSVTGLTLLPIYRVDSNLNVTLSVGAEQESIALVSLDHVSQFAREYVVASVFALLLPCHWVDVGNW